MPTISHEDIGSSSSGEGRKTGSYLVIGGAGFIGQNIALDLYQRGNKVLIVDPLIHGMPTLDLHGIPIIPKRIQEVTRDELPAHIDYVIHAATMEQVTALTTPDARSDIYDSLVYTVSCLFPATTPITFLSTTAMQTNPEHQGELKNPYAWWKTKAEEYLSGHDNCKIVRLSNVYGPGMYFRSRTCGFPGKVLYSLRRFNPIFITAMDLPRMYTYVLDVSDAVIRITKYGQRNRYSLTSTSILSPIEVLQTARVCIPLPDANIVLTSPRSIDVYREYTPPKNFIEIECKTVFADGMKSLNDWMLSHD